MSSHTISHADRFQAGNAVAFNKPDEFANNLRGVPIQLLAVEHFDAIAAPDTDAYATAQTAAAGGQQDLTLDGAEVTEGVGIAPAVMPVDITAAANDSARTFTVLGRDANGRPQAEEIAGPNATTVTGTKTFSRIDRIFVDADTAGAVQAGFDNAAKRGLRTKAEDLRDFMLIVEDNIVVLNGSFFPGNNTLQTATNADNRASVVPGSADAELDVMYLADLTKEGIGSNFVDSSQRVPSAI